MHPSSDEKVAGILFDISGVLVALDGMPSLAAWLGIEPQHDVLHAMWMASPSVVAHETGKIGAAEFAVGVVSDLGLPITPDAFLQDFSRWPGALLSGALQILDEIPDRYHLAALSNTSVLHWETIGALSFVERFDDTYLSHRIGHLKPAKQAFLVALEGMRLSPSEVRFIDDGLRNVEAARALGMHAQVARGPKEARTVLVEYGVVPAHDGASLP